jgi:hypothetical protein
MQGDRRVGTAEVAQLSISPEKTREIRHRQRGHRVVARDDRHQRIERQNADAPRQGRILRRLVPRGQPFGRIGFPQAEGDIDLAVQKREKPLIRGARGHEEPGRGLIIGPDERVDDRSAVLERTRSRSCCAAKADRRSGRSPSATVAAPAI